LIFELLLKTWQLLKQNPTLFKRYFVKEYIIKAIRQFFEKRNYHELESPILTSTLPQERYLDVLETTIELVNKQKKTAYLIPSTETFNKKMLAAGLGEHFVITKVFRGLEDIGPNHSPEFTMLEWYHLNTDYFGLMDDCEQLFTCIKKYLDKKFNRNHTMVIHYQDQKIDFTPPWDRLSVSEALKHFTNLELGKIQTVKSLKAAALKKGYHVEEINDWQIIFEEIFLNEIEPNLSKNRPTFLYDYPRILCPLTKVNKNNPLVSEKVELYIAGREIANGYTELLDYKEQKKRFVEEQKARKELGRKEIKMDIDLVEALKSGLPPVAGIGMGIDRLAMIIADAKNISEINFFPSSEMFTEQP
jgi:EF-P lysine aminoacylase GenX